jgi:hypothetical protein
VKASKTYKTRGRIRTKVRKSSLISLGALLYWEKSQRSKFSRKLEIPEKGLGLIFCFLTVFFTVFRMVRTTGIFRKITSRTTGK